MKTFRRIWMASVPRAPRRAGAGRTWRELPEAPDRYRALLQDLPASSRVLLAVSERIGDALFRTPAIRLLANAYPAVVFDALAFGGGAAAVLSRHPDIRKVHALRDPAAIRQLARGYDIIINMRTTNRRHLTYLDCPLISCRRTSPKIHRTDDILAFTARYLLPGTVSLSDMDRRYVLRLLPEDHRRVDEALRRFGLDSTGLVRIGLHMGCLSVDKYRFAFSLQDRWHHRKVWPVERFAELSRRLSQHLPHRRILVVGSAAERFLGERLRRLFPGAINLCGEITVVELAALMDRLSLLVANDSGPMHIACARGAPVIALCGATDPIQTGPHPSDPRFRAITGAGMLQITVGEVHEAAEALLALETL